MSMSIPSEQRNDQTDQTVIDFEEVPGVECDAIQERLEQTRTNAAENRLDPVRTCEQYVEICPSNLC
jgi:hypothetical protein